MGGEGIAGVVKVLQELLRFCRSSEGNSTLDGFFLAHA